MNLKQRIEKAEKAAGIEQEKDQPVLVLLYELGEDDSVPHFEEPWEQWVTLQANLEDSRRRHVPCILIKDPFAEYEARHGLELTWMHGAKSWRADYQQGSENLRNDLKPRKNACRC